MYIYHRKPPEMIGHVLYPLNQLKQINFSRFQHEMFKYTQSPQFEHIPMMLIPKLQCFWNDVIQCSPFHPYYIYKTLSWMGEQINPHISFFKIPVSAIKEPLLAIYKYRKTHFKGAGAPIAEEEIEIIHKHTYQELNGLPQDTLEWYRTCIKRGRIRGLFHLTPHVLLKEALDTRCAEQITWDQSPS
jgi:hypothetical protein